MDEGNFAFNSDDDDDDDVDEGGCGDFYSKDECQVKCQHEDVVHWCNPPLDWFNTILTGDGDGDGDSDVDDDGDDN